MFKKITGYVLVALGFLGATFFSNYEGSIISFPTFWEVLAIIIGILGGYLIVTAKSKTVLKSD